MSLPMKNPSLPIRFFYYGYRIVLAGYYEEHESLLDEGWQVHRWSAAGGYATLGDGQGLVNRQGRRPPESG